MLRLLPRELKEELWKFVHYIPTSWEPKQEQSNRGVHYQDNILVNDPPHILLYLMAYYENISCQWTLYYLYYAIDGMAVYAECSGETVFDENESFCQISIRCTYRSRRMRDLFMHIDHIKKLVPDYDLWEELVW